MNEERIDARRAENARGTGRVFGAGVVGGLLGAALTAFILLGRGNAGESAMTEELRSQLSNSSSHTADLARAITALSSQIEGMSRLPAVVPDGNGGSVEPLAVSSADPTAASLSKEVDRLVDAMSHLSALIVSSAAAPTSSEPSLTDADLTKPTDVSALRSVYDKEDVARDLQHLGWSMRQLLIQYGAPTTIEMGGQGGKRVEWTYRLGGKEKLVYFIEDGQVIKVEKF